MSAPKIVVNDESVVSDAGTAPTARSGRTDSTAVRRPNEDARAFLRENSTTESAEAVYGLNPAQLAGLVDPKDVYILQEMGGPDALARVLNTDLQRGLVTEQLGGAELKQRTDFYATNLLPEKKTKSLVSIIWETLNDKILIVLIIAAVISLALGLYETFGEPPEYDPEGRPLPKVDWVEGVAILVAVVIVTVVGSLNDWQKELQFAKLNRKKDERKIQVIRNGVDVQVPIEEVLVGDLVYVMPGDVLAVDGVLIRGNDVNCDESSATGESDTLHKYPAAEALERVAAGDAKTGEPFAPHDKKVDCMMLSGAKVLEGTGVYLVTAVGKNSLFGKTMLSLQDEGTEITPLQEKLNRIADGIAKFGVIAAVLLFIVLFIRFLVNITHGDYQYLKSSQKGSHFMDIFIVAVTIIVVAVPEGLPLAVTLALAFATTRMIKDNNLVRVLKSCETMGGATTVCSDKTGTLTQNKMTVVAATVGADEWVEADIVEKARPVAIAEEKLLLDSLAINSSVYEEQEEPINLIGSKTEIALVNFAREFLHLNTGQLRAYRDETNVVRTIPFDSGRKFMASVIALDKPGTFRVFVKGAAEILLGRTAHYWTADGLLPIEERRQFIDEQVVSYANLALRPIACAFRDFESSGDMTRASLDDLPLDGLTFLALFGIKDPLRPGVVEAVRQCHRAGVVVRMVTGDNIRTARAIAVNAGIIEEDDKEAVVIEGPQFRNLDDETLLRIVPKLRVLARSSPQDKRKLVAFLKEQGETVAVTGDGTNDAPALRLADVGFSMGIAGTEVAKEASDIIIMDDNFASIVNAIKWGRTVNDGVKRFLQFQLTVNITAVVLTFVSAVANKDNKSVLTAVQLLWVNLIMDTLAALALATDPPTDSVLDRKPDNRKVPLITPTMWKMILGQSTFQLCVTLVLHFAGPAIWGIAGKKHDSRLDTQLAAMVFNAFVWMQFFKLWVSRRVDNKQNIFEGLLKNPIFWVVAAIIAGFQVLIMFVGGAAFSIRRQTGPEWGVALVAGVLSLPMGFMLRLVPDAWILAIYPAWLVNFVLRVLSLLGKGLAWLFWPVGWLWHQFAYGVKWLFYRARGKPVPADEDEEGAEAAAVDEKDAAAAKTRGAAGPRSAGVRRTQSYEWNAGIQRSIDELAFIRRVHGGRVRRFKLHRPLPWKREQPGLLAPTAPGLSARSSFGNMSGSTTFSAALMAPVVVSGAVGGWSPKPVSPPQQQQKL